MNGSRPTGRILGVPLVRVIEHAVSIPEVTATRYFSVLWPLWQVEVSADAYDEQTYDMIDRFVVRAVLEGGLSGLPDIADFLGVSPGLVVRCTRFLELIGHLNFADGQVWVTELGRDSHRRDVRLVRRESRRKLLFESFTAQPLPREYYSLRILSTSDVAFGSVPAYWFPVASTTSFRFETVSELVTRPDRDLYNVPQHLIQLSGRETENVFIPIQVVETLEHGLLAYTQAAPTRDEFFEDVFRRIPTLDHLIAAQRPGNPEQIWTEWLADPGRAGGLLRRRPDSGWRAVMRASEFGESGSFAVRDVGSFRTSKQHFIQIWCDDQDVRKRALLERSLAIATMSSIVSRQALVREITRVSGLLELPVPGIEELYEQALAAGLRSRLGALDALE